MFLEGIGIDLGLREIEGHSWRRKLLIRFNKKLGVLSKFTGYRIKLGTLPITSRFEFSLMPANGGHILPHTDAPTKIITMVIPLIGPSGWDASWGGGTEILRIKNKMHSFNHVNRYRQFDEFDTVKTFEFQKNRRLLFIKTFNSWHAVRPMSGPNDMFRATLTINIETKPLGYN